MLRSRTSSTARRRPLRAAALPACLLALAAAAPAAHAEPTLGPPDTRTTLDHPEGVVLADVDHDGFDDAVVGNRDEQTIQLFRGSAGGFLPPTAHATGHNLPAAVAVGDMNGDGHPDLLSGAAVGSDNGRIAVLLGDGAGGFAPAPGSPFAMTIDGPNSAAALRVADITGDGRLDVVAGADNQLVVMPGDGSGRLLAPAIDTLEWSRVNSITVGDFVGDAALDVVTGSGQPQTISEIFLNRGGRLEFNSLVEETGNAVIAADLDGAGHDDLAFTRMSGNDVGTRLSTGDARFADPQIFEAGMVFVAGMALRDVDADGRDDLLVGGEGAVELFVGSGAPGGFATFPAGSIGTAGTSFDVALGDVTGDGQPDLVHTTQDTDALTLVKNLNVGAASGTAAVDFGSAQAGGAAIERTVRLTSGGSGFYRVRSAAVTPGDVGATIAADGCSGRSLAVGESCELTVRMTPGATAGAVAATLTLADNSAGGTRAIPLSAVVAAVPGVGGGAGRGGAGGGAGPGAAPAGADRTAPRVSGLRLAPATFAVARGATAISAGRAKRAPKRGTSIRFTLSETARVTLTVERRANGLRSGRRCVAPSAKLRRAHAKGCTRFVAAGTLVRNGRAGANAVTFSGRIGRRALPAGRYRLTATAVDGAGNRAATARTAFTVVRGR